jgi:hypothetical protein
MLPNHPPHTVEALYDIGRNVVSFQRLEHILKQFALLAPICATPSTLQSAVEKQRAKAQRLTLGQARKDVTTKLSFPSDSSFPGLRNTSISCRAN